jgi:hypothetical protein
MKREIKKVDTITPEELSRGWWYFRGKKKSFWTNSALMGLVKSAILCGGNYSQSVYLPHRRNLNTKCVEVFKADFFQTRLDETIKCNFSLPQ